MQEEPIKKELIVGYVNLKEHFDALWDERKEQLNLHFTLLKEALVKNDTEIERRLIGLNELRAEYTNDRTHDRQMYVRQETFDARVEEIKKIEKRLTVLETRIITWTAALALFFLLAQLILKLWWR